MPPVAHSIEVMGEEGQTETHLSTLTPTMVRPAWAKPLLTAPQWVNKHSAESPKRGTSNVQNGVQGNMQGA